MNDNRLCQVTLDVQRSEQPPVEYMRYIRFHLFIHSFIQRPDKIGGGVALCVNNNISSYRRHDLEPQEEIVVCEVKPNNQSKILYILAYKPPNGDVSQFICNVSPLLKAATSNFKNVCLLGDLTCEILIGLITHQSLILVIHFVI